MSRALFFLFFFLFLSCAEKLMVKPENLIPKEKMVQILSDLAMVNAAKVVNPQILRNHDINPTDYIFTKYSIDSIQFVESDRYYASIPDEHEAIYIEVEAILEVEKERAVAIKRVKDSLKTIDKKTPRKELTAKDSLPKIDGKKK